MMEYSNADSGENSFLLRGELDPFLDKMSEELLKAALLEGVGYLHEGLNDLEHDTVAQLFETGRIQVCVLSSSMCWGVTLSAHVVVVIGTQYYDKRDYPVTDLLQMMGHASRPLVDNSGNCFILGHSSSKEYKFLHEGFPVESHLHHFLHDNLNAEIAAGIIKNKKDALDYLAWTFMYRHLSCHLSEMVDNTLSDLKASKCIAIEDDADLFPLLLGRIASSHYVSYTTIERFSSSLTSETKIEGLLEALSSAPEYAQLPIRPGEEGVIRTLIHHQRFSFENPEVTDPHVKANALLQAHFSRKFVGGNLALDQKEVLLSANKLLLAMLDVISNNGWLSPALLTMEVSQMVTQGIWDDDFLLLQLPHFTDVAADNCRGVVTIETVHDYFTEGNDEARALVDMTVAQFSDLLRTCSRLPDIELSFQVLDNDNVQAGEEITLHVTLDRLLDDRINMGHGPQYPNPKPMEKGKRCFDINKNVLGPVDAPRYPKAKKEGWWLVVGDTVNNMLLAVKHVLLKWRLKETLKFAAPADAGTKTYELHFVCDSYLGFDQELEFTIDVKEADGGD